MCHWKKWVWPGIITVLILSMLAVWMKRDFIQDDLTAKANSALAQNGQSWATVKMDGRDATLMGDSPNEEASNQAAEIADAAYEVRIVDNQSGMMAAQSPYEFKAVLAGNNVELTGYVPDEEVRSTIVDTAKELLPDVTVNDSMTLARGAPENLDMLAGFGFNQLTGLTKGEFSLSDSAISLTGAAKTIESYDSINGALDTKLPNGATLAHKAITPPNASPYIWSADYSGEKVTLNGFVPSTEVAQNLVASAKSTLPNAEVVDNQQLADGAPDDFQNAAGYALQQLPRFRSGKVALSDLNLDVTGVANSSSNYTDALGAIAEGALPAGLNLADSNISPATVSPYNWAATHDGTAMEISGFVPDDTSRDQIRKAAGTALPDANVSDGMQVAAGAPEGFVGATDFALSQLSRLSQGNASLNDLGLTIGGPKFYQHLQR